MGRTILGVSLLSYVLIAAIVPLDTIQSVEGVILILFFGGLGAIVSMLQSWIFWIILVGCVIVYLLMSIREEIIANR